MPWPLTRTPSSLSLHMLIDAWSVMPWPFPAFKDVAGTEHSLHCDEPCAERADPAPGLRCARGIRRTGLPRVQVRGALAVPSSRLPHVQAAAAASGTAVSDAAAAVARCPLPRNMMRSLDCILNGVYRDTAPRRPRVLLLFWAPDHAGDHGGRERLATGADPDPTATRCVPTTLPVGAFFCLWTRVRTQSVPWGLIAIARSRYTCKLPPAPPPGACRLGTAVNVPQPTAADGV